MPAFAAELDSRLSKQRSRIVNANDVLANIESARQVGLHAIWFKDAAQCRRVLDEILGN
jgi:hypothetical protein